MEQAIDQVAAQRDADAFSAASGRVINGTRTFRLNHLEIRILSCHRRVQSGNYPIPEHEHPNYELSWMRSGSMTSRCDSFKIRTSPAENRIFFVPPLTLHSRRFGAEPCCVNDTMMLMITGADEIGRQLARILPVMMREQGYSFAMTDGLQALLNQFERRIFLHNSDGGTESALLHAWIGTFLLDFFPALFEPSSLRKYAVGAEFETAGERIAAIKNALEDSFASNRPLQNCAERFGLSLRHLNRIFQQGTGLTLAGYLARRRLEAAENMLFSSRASIGEIAAALGFSTPEQFAVFFRRHRQCTPSEFRRRPPEDPERYEIY